MSFKKDCEIAALQERIEELESQNAVVNELEFRSNVAANALLQQRIEKLEADIGEKDRMLADFVIDINNLQNIIADAPHQDLCAGNIQESRCKCWKSRAVCYD